MKDYNKIKDSMCLDVVTFLHLLMSIILSRQIAGEPALNTLSCSFSCISHEFNTAFLPNLRLA